MPAVKIALVALAVSPIPPPIPAKGLKSGGGIVRDGFAGRHRSAGDHRRATRDGGNRALRQGALEPSMRVSCQSGLHIDCDSSRGWYLRLQACACFRWTRGTTIDLNLGPWSRRVHRRRLDLGGARHVVADRQRQPSSHSRHSCSWAWRRSRLGGPVPENRTSLAIATSSRHPGVALLLARANFPAEKLVVAAVLLYLLVNAVLAIPYLLWIKRRRTQLEERMKVSFTALS